MLHHIPTHTALALAIQETRHFKWIEYKTSFPHTHTHRTITGQTTFISNNHNATSNRGGKEREERKLWSPKVWVRIYRCVYSSRCPMANGTGWFILELNINWRAYVVEMKLKHQTCFLYFIYYYNTSSDANELKLKHLENQHTYAFNSLSAEHRHTSFYTYTPPAAA